MPPKVPPKKKKKVKRYRYYATGRETDSSDSERTKEYWRALARRRQRAIQPIPVVVAVPVPAVVAPVLPAVIEPDTEEEETSQPTK
jgi:hypothetical protein